MRRKINPYNVQNWLRQMKDISIQFVIPLSIFQGIRTILFPTTFDVFLLAALILLALAFQLEWL
ncbi:hypothetical protein GJU40_18760 [Bacillus lacus]|uniref:Uncharacterized protein n=1 Tax=Metabacillus lacus TaxID=1983721 RepID=A0A7X2M040_9BACI|nr:hypothetical protein [Metabacillus lacus]